MTNYRGGDPKVALRQRCRALRRTSTDAESLLWRLLRARQVAGAKFRRQHQFSPYILDFFCPERKLAIEVDGDRHAIPDRITYDAARTAFFNTLGIQVFRFSNREVLQETESVLLTIWDATENPHPNPLPRGEGDAADFPLPLGEGEGEGKG